MARYRTEQRKLLQLYFSEHPHEPYSAKELSQILGSDTVSVSAIYRNIAELEKMGLLRRSQRPGSREALYEYTGQAECREHLHLSCRMCGSTYHLNASETDLLIGRIAAQNHFSVDKSQTVIYGICAACQNS